MIEALTESLEQEQCNFKKDLRIALPQYKARAIQPTDLLEN